MDKKKTYISMQDEISEISYKLEHLADGDNLIGNDVIFDYRKGYPRPQSVVGRDRGKEERLTALYSKRIKALNKECRRMEKWVESLPDSMDRRIARKYYLEGLSQEEIARDVHMDRSSVSRKLQKLQKSQ